jgi:hypothetical protein
VAALNDSKQRFPRLLICEGHEDHAFFHQLIQVRGLPPFHIRPSDGNSQFAQAIAKFRLENTKAYNALQNIVIAADNDEDPKAKFKNVCIHIERVFGAGTAPSNPQEKAKTRPYVSVLMLPWTKEHGHLEYLCCDSADDADRTAASRIDDLLALCGADKWTNSRWGKAWLRANLAIRCEQDPFVALGHVFSDARYQHLIPVDHPSLNQIAAFLGSFA